ncbi:MAG: hypothetical protein RBR15_05710 [Sphaerochaeta sp.]|nr:hypothetical protein [Sphaerochaeta sp.]
MKKRFPSLSLLIILLFSLPLYSSAYSPRTINIHCPLYEETELLYRLQGLPLPSGARPWSTSEAALLLSAIPDGGETAKLKAVALSRLGTTLPKQDSNGLSHRFSTTVALEAYAHANTTQFIIPTDWSYNAERRLPFLDFRMELQWNTTLYFATHVEMGPSPRKPGDDTKGFAGTPGVGAIIGANSMGPEYLTRAQLYQMGFNTNIMTTSKEFQTNWPRHTQMTLGGPWWNLSLGKGPVSWGVGQSGNLIIGSHIDSHNNLNISFFSEEIKLQLLYLFLPNPLRKPEERIFLGHRLESRPLPWLRVAVSENIMFQGESLHFGYIDPTFIYHNIYNADNFNALAGLELHIALAPGLSLYSQLALDQYQLPNEGDSEANAFGYLVGVTHSIGTKRGFFTSNLEFVATDPSLYRRDLVDFLVIRGLRNNNNPMAFDYLGYRWGSDSIALSAEVVYLIPGKARYALNALVHRQGGVTLFGPHNTDGTNTGTSNINGPPPSGDIMTDQIVITMEGSWWLKKAPVRIFGELTWIGKQTYTKSTKRSSGQRGDLQLVAGALYTF